MTLIKLLVPQVSFNGGVGSLVLDTIGHTFSQKYHNRVIQVWHPSSISICFFSSFCGTRYLITSMLVLSMSLLISNDKGFSNICAVIE